MAASQDTSDLVVNLDSVVRGHHVYKRIWTPTIGEQLQLRPEENNENDPRAVKHGVIVGHLPRKTARTVWFFLKRGGAGECEITGRRRRGKGLEVPCVYRFSGPYKLVKKLESLQKESINTVFSCPY